MGTSRFLSGRKANNSYLREKKAPKIKGYGYVEQWPVFYLMQRSIICYLCVPNFSNTCYSINFPHTFTLCLLESENILEQYVVVLFVFKEKVYFVFIYIGRSK